jgi:RNA polymerase-binding transcription factor DksA
MLSVTDLGTIKLAMLRQIDTTLRQSYHQTLLEVLNELRMRSIVAQPDPSPDKVFSVILQTHILTYKSAPATSMLRDALERMVRGKYGLCIRCGKEIAADLLVNDPSQPFCTLCQPSANG